MIAAAFALAALACADSSITRKIVVAPQETLVVVRQGTGTPVVIVPGLLGSTYAFRKVTARLVDAGWSVVLIEPLGFGESSRPAASDYSLPSQAARVNAVLDTLGISQALFIAHNMGASIAFRIAVKHPERVAAMISIDAGAVERPTTPGVKNALRLAPIVEFFGANFIVWHKIASALRAHSYDASWVTDSVVAVYSEPITHDMTGTLRALKKLSLTEPGDSLHPQLVHVTVPVVLLIGRAVREGGVTAPEVDRLRATLPMLRVDSVDRSGEYIHEERPEVVVAAAIGLQQYASASPAAQRDPNCPPAAPTSPPPAPSRR